MKRPQRRPPGTLGKWQMGDNRHERCPGAEGPPLPFVPASAPENLRGRDDEAGQQGRLE